MFKEAFKYYKRRDVTPDFTNVIDFENPDPLKVRKLHPQYVISNDERKQGLISVQDWMIYEIADIPGLIFIKNPFFSNGQRYWITKCLKDFSKKPSKLNIDAHNYLNNNESWWDVCFQYPEEGKPLISKLRWATLGYHHDWDTKVYSESCKTIMPEELVNLTETFAKPLGFPTFKAEAAIINYYRMNSTLAGHTDHSEINMEAPLFSISFGQTAIFLIGGLTPEDPATALFLRSGDVIVMSGQSRQRYHGVPRILPAISYPWESDLQNNEIYVNPTDWKTAETYISEARINMNVRQVLNPGQMNLY